MKAVNVLLGLTVFSIGFLVGGAAFNVGFCKGVQGAIVAGSLKAPREDETTATGAPVRLDNQSEADFKLMQSIETGAVSLAPVYPTSWSFEQSGELTEPFDLQPAMGYRMYQGGL